MDYYISTLKAVFYALEKDFLMKDSNELCTI